MKLAIHSKNYVHISHVGFVTLVADWARRCFHSVRLLYSKPPMTWEKLQNHIVSILFWNFYKISHVRFENWINFQKESSFKTHVPFHFGQSNCSTSLFYQSRAPAWLSPPPPNVIYSWFWYAFSLFLRKIHSVQTFKDNFCEPGRAVHWEKDGNSISGCQQNIFYSIFSQIRTVFEPVQGPCTMNVRNELVHVMVCVVKRESPSVWRWRLCEFQHGKSVSENK